MYNPGEWRLLGLVFLIGSIALVLAVIFGPWLALAGLALAFGLNWTVINAIGAVWAGLLAIFVVAMLFRYVRR